MGISTDKKLLETVSFYSFKNPSKEIEKKFNLQSVSEIAIIVDDHENPGRAKLVKYPHDLHYNLLKKFITLNFKKEEKEEKINETRRKSIENIENKNIMEPNMIYVDNNNI